MKYFFFTLIMISFLFACTGNTKSLGMNTGTPLPDDSTYSQSLPVPETAIEDTTEVNDVFITEMVDIKINRDWDKYPEDTTEYPQCIDWGYTLLDMPKAEKTLRKWIRKHPDYHNWGRDLWRDHIHLPLITLVKIHPETMDYDFPILKNKEYYFYSVTSKDGRLKVYSWDTATGGTCHYLDGLCQYRCNGKVKSVYGGINFLLEGKERAFPNEEPWDDDAPFVYEIHDIQTDNGENYYLLFSYRRFSTILFENNVDLCKITDKGVVRINGFKHGEETHKRLSSNINLSRDDILAMPIFEHNDSACYIMFPISDEKCKYIRAEKYMFTGNEFAFIDQEDDL